jgi:pyruvate ferredoxin oxidoreductase gamma subunit/2-oxoisovalerate ferredoxin oxidoreductase gamma subunit
MSSPSNPRRADGAPGGARPIEVRLHGRGGQGAVVASTLLARAAMLGGAHVQAFPDFGVERRGAPVTAFLRLSDRPIRVRSKVYRPDHVLLFDPRLLALAPLPAGRAGWVVVNAQAAPAALGVPEPWRVATVDATEIALALGLGSRALPIVNSPMAAAFARATGLCTLPDLESAIGELLPASVVARNLAAARLAWESLSLSPAWQVEALERAFGEAP